jgi:hypothetical protein
MFVKFKNCAITAQFAQSSHIYSDKRFSILCRTPKLNRVTQGVIVRQQVLVGDVRKYPIQEGKINGRA